MSCNKDFPDSCGNEQCSNYADYMKLVLYDNKYHRLNLCTYFDQIRFHINLSLDVSIYND